MPLISHSGVKGSVMKLLRCMLKVVLVQYLFQLSLTSAAALIPYGASSEFD